MRGICSKAWKNLFYFNSITYQTYLSLCQTITGALSEHAKIMIVRRDGIVGVANDAWRNVAVALQLTLNWLTTSVQVIFNEL